MSVQSPIDVGKLTTPSPTRQRPEKRGLVVNEILRFAYETFMLNKVRFALTALGMIIGTASLILVVTIGLTGKQYILAQIQAVGANMIYAYYEGGGSIYGTENLSDYLTVADMNAVQQQVPGIKAASPMLEFHDRILIGGGKEKDVKILGVGTGYQSVRNLMILAGRYFDDQDVQSRAKVVLLNNKLADTLYGGQDQAVGQPIKITGLPFTIIGTFKERVETFGQSEVSSDTIAMPYTTSFIFTGSNSVKQLFFSVADAADVPRATEQIKSVLNSRHRPDSVYHVENLTALLDVASKIANALTAVLLLIATVTLIVSGVGIMNIMLATVSARIREIGIRKAIGATNREIRFQFLAEAIFISLSGGIIGIIIGLALPLSVRWFTDFRIPISGLSAIIAIIVSSLVGVLFGTVPAARAANLDPVESLRYE
ncbi:MAG TPA: ABC transporter permease [Terriglobales bacterium]|nr:ABC transporter permease [Terriglobales bacterium]